MIKGTYTSNIYSSYSPLPQGLKACPSRPKKSSNISTSSPNQPSIFSSAKQTPTTSISSPTIPPNFAAPSPAWPPTSTSPTGASSSSLPPWNAPEAGRKAATCNLGNWLDHRCGLGPCAARERIRIGRALARLPRIDAAFRDGVISYSKVRAITRVATPDTDAMLLAITEGSSAAHLESLVRTYERVGKGDGERGLQRTAARLKLVLRGRHAGHYRGGAR